jgi:hypothetical protein
VSCDEEIDGDSRLLNRDSRQTLRVFGIGNRKSDLHSVEAGKGDNLSGGSLGNLEAIESLVREQFRHARLVAFLRSIQRKQHDGIADVHRPTLDAPNAEPAEVRRMVDRRDQHLKGLRIAGRSGYVTDDRVEQRR